MTTESNPMTLDEAAEMLGSSPTAVRKLVSTGRLEATIAPGGNLVFARSAISRLLRVERPSWNMRARTTPER